MLILGSRLFQRQESGNLRVEKSVLQTQGLSSSITSTELQKLVERQKNVKVLGMNILWTILDNHRIL